MIERNVIELLARGAEVDLALVARVIAASEPERIDRVRLHDLLELASRLPTGLIHADAIWMLESRPSDLTPLAPGSPWSAMERSLVVESRDATSILIDLGRYRLAAASVHALLLERQELGASLAGELDASLKTELSVLLEASIEEIEKMDRRAPQLRADLAAMAQTDFLPAIHLHDDVRPDRLLERGDQLGLDLLARLPDGDFWVLISDGITPIEMVSPYVRDLGHALSRWGLENSGRLCTFGLSDALREHEEAPDADLVAMVVPDLFRSSPDLLDERRQNESSQGLYLEERRGTVFGWADLSQLASPDRGALPEGLDGALAMICRGAPEVLLGASRRLLSSGRVLGVAHLVAADVRGDVVVANMLASSDDGFHLAGAPLLMEKATELGIAVHPIGTMEDPPETLVKLLRATRHARVRNELADSAMIFSLMTPVLADGATPTVKGRRAALSAARLALATMTSAPSSRDRTMASKSSTSGQKPSFQRRFRA